MKKWSSSSSNHQLQGPPAHMRKKLSCLPLPAVPSILPVKSSVGTLSRVSINNLYRIRLFLIRITWDKWMVLRALYFLVSLMWEMKIQVMWVVALFTRRVREVTVRDLRVRWVSITSNSNRSSRHKIVICSRPLCNQGKQQPSWCLPRDSP